MRRGGCGEEGRGGEGGMGDEKEGGRGREVMRRKGVGEGV